jgi:hypothetical protein
MSACLAEVSVLAFFDPPPLDFFDPPAPGRARFVGAFTVAAVPFFFLDGAILDAEFVMVPVTLPSSAAAWSVPSLLGGGWLLSE